MSTRIDDKKYSTYYTEVSNAINANATTECLGMNHIPREWAKKEPYCEKLDPNRGGE